MIILGFVLLVAAAVFGLDLIWKNHFKIRDPALFGQTLGIHNAAVFFILAAITGAVLMLGVVMIMAGLRRRAAKARQHRQERKEAKKAGRERDKARQENEKLRDQIDREHQDGSTASASGNSGATAIDEA